MQQKLPFGSRPRCGQQNVTTLLAWRPRAIPQWRNVSCWRCKNSFVVARPPCRSGGFVERGDPPRKGVAAGAEHRSRPGLCHFAIADDDLAIDDYPVDPDRVGVKPALGSRARKVIACIDG